MDVTFLALSMLFGCFGLGFFVYGKRQRQIIPWVVGVLLMTIPYFIGDTLIMSLVEVGLIAGAILLRHHWL